MPGCNANIPEAGLPAQSSSTPRRYAG